MKIKSMAEISLFAVLSAVGARIMIPVPFVPFTLQTLVCMIAGFALGARKGRPRCQRGSGRILERLVGADRHRAVAVHVDGHHEHAARIVVLAFR